MRSAEAARLDVECEVLPRFVTGGFASRREGCNPSSKAVRITALHIEQEMHPNFSFSAFQRFPFRTPISVFQIFSLSAFSSDCDLRFLPLTAFSR